MKTRQRPMLFTDAQLAACLRIWPHLYCVVDRFDKSFVECIWTKAQNPAWTPTVADTGRMRTILARLERREAQIIEYLKQTR